jgi:hypothetical protein
MIYQVDSSLFAEPYNLLQIKVPNTWFNEIASVYCCAVDDYIS